jgi:hypothetical protein
MFFIGINFLHGKIRGRFFFNSNTSLRAPSPGSRLQKTSYIIPRNPRQKSEKFDAFLRALSPVQFFNNYKNSINIKNHNPAKCRDQRVKKLKNRIEDFFRARTVKKWTPSSGHLARLFFNLHLFNIKKINYPASFQFTKQASNAWHSPGPRWVAILLLKTQTNQRINQIFHNDCLNKYNVN